MSHKPRKKFGQNFLQDENVILRIIDAIQPQTFDHIVEIGPGLGALTLKLLTILKEMDAIEIDRDIIPSLMEKTQGIGTLNIHQEDVLTFDFSTLFQRYQQKLRVVGNLPYNISTPLLFHLFQQNDCVQDMHFMLQKEVAERLSAQQGGKEYGRLSIMAQYHCDIHLLFNVPPDAFWPKPKVFSTVLRLIPKTPKLNANNYALFQEIVKQAFNQRRKTLKNCLKQWVTEKQLLDLDINPQNRPEEISIEKYVKISNMIVE